MYSAGGDPKKIIRDKWPFYWVSQVNSAYSTALERRIRHHGIDIPRWRAMMSLYEDKYLSVSEIAAFSAQKLNTTTKVVQRMICDDLVTTRVRPTDGRVTEVCLTKKGEDLRNKAFADAQSVFDHAFENIDKSEIQELNRILAKLNGQLQKL